MTPTITSAMTYSKEHLPLTHKLRKPLVEKIRRERINSSIEQIKSLLGPEILSQQPDSKLEKADILEMTVSFLRQLQQQQYKQTSSSCSTVANKGYSKCVQQLVHFLSKDEVKTSQSQRRLLSHFQPLESSCDKKSMERALPQLSSPVPTGGSKEKSPVTITLWRPWKTL